MLTQGETLTYVWITQKIYSYPSVAIYIYQYMCQGSGSTIISGFYTSKVTEAFRTTTLAKGSLQSFRRQTKLHQNYIRGHFGVNVDLNECR